MNSANFVRSSALFMSFLVLSLPIVFAEELNLIYDKNGNLVTGDGLYRVYNGFNQLWKIYNGSDSSGMLLQELIHDPEEERILVKKLFNESGNNYETVYYPAKNYVRVVNNSGTYDYLYVYHEGQLIAVRHPDGTKEFYHPDHLGSTALITDESGDVVEETEYSPFGVILSGGNSRYDYEGKEFDKITGAFDFHFRNYCAKWGKFCQPDTLIPNVYGPQTLNRYAFEENNPWTNTDPDGHAVPLVVGVMVVGVILMSGYVMQKEANKAQEKYHENVPEEDRSEGLEKWKEFNDAISLPSDITGSVKDLQLLRGTTAKIASAISTISTVSSFSYAATTNIQARNYRRNLIKAERGRAHSRIIDHLDNKRKGGTGRGSRDGITDLIDKWLEKNPDKEQELRDRLKEDN